MKTLNILIVDDEPGIRSGIKRILDKHRISFPYLDEDFDFACHEAGTGEEGLELMGQVKPDIVLLDNKLPGMQGVEVLEQMNQMKCDCKVAMITSYPSVDVAKRATADGASDFIPKPFTPAELKASLETIVKQLYLKRLTRGMKKEGKEMRFQFLSVLSHELKSPLNAILGYLDIIKNKQLGEDVDTYMQMIERSVARANGMKGLIMDLLDMTRLDMSNEVQVTEEVNLREVAGYAIETAKPLAIQNDITINLYAPKELTCTAKMSDMEIIFNNLVSNAVKYNKPGGTVWIKIEKTAGTIIIEVKDSGIGMSKEDQAKLFNEFVRIRNEKTKYITGSGLGLSILKKTCQRYGGDISVESEPEKGSKFTVKLPDNK
jgi:two-component system, sensor histidine kinase and response regulator